MRPPHASRRLMCISLPQGAASADFPVGPRLRSSPGQLARLSPQGLGVGLLHARLQSLALRPVVGTAVGVPRRPRRGRWEAAPARSPRFRRARGSPRLAEAFACSGCNLGARKQQQTELRAPRCHRSSPPPAASTRPSWSAASLPPCRPSWHPWPPESGESPRRRPCPRRSPLPLAKTISSMCSRYLWDRAKA
jgi:hypothetical protein